MDSSSQKRCWLKLERKIEVLANYARGDSIKKLTKDFKVSRHQITNIIARKDEITKKWEKGERNSKRYTTMKCRYDDVNKKVLEWFSKTRCKNMPVTGPMMQQKALTIARDLGHNNFTASSGWLESFNKRNNIRFSAVKEKRNDVTQITEADCQSPLVPCKVEKEEEIIPENEFSIVLPPEIELKESFSSDESIRNSRDETREKSDFELDCDEGFKGQVISHQEAWEMTSRLIKYACSTSLTNEMIAIISRLQDKIWRARELDLDRNKQASILNFFSKSLD